MSNVSAGSTTRRGIWSSRLTNASAVNSSIVGVIRRRRKREVDDDRSSNDASKSGALQLRRVDQMVLKLCDERWRFSEAQRGWKIFLEYCMSK